MCNTIEIKNILNDEKIELKEVKEVKAETGNKKLNIYDIAQNRELSWLKFNQRVLNEALDHTYLYMKS